MSNTIIDLSVDDDAEESPAWATPLRSPARTKREPPSLCPTSCTISLDSDEETEVSASGWSGSGREAAEMADIGSAWKRRHVECDSGGCSAPDCLQEDIKLYDTTSGAAGIQRAQTEFKPFAHPALGAPPPPRSMTAPPPPPPNPFFDQEDSKTPAELLRLILGEDGDDVDLANAASVERVDHATAATEAGFTYNSELDVFQVCFSMCMCVRSPLLWTGPESCL